MQFRRSQSRRSHREGLTLIEVMIVLFILVILSTIGVVAVQGTLNKAREREAAIFVNSMKTPLDTYLLDHGNYPPTEQGLDALLNPMNADPYVDKNAIKADPWGMPYQYIFPGRQNGPSGYDLWSLGPDMAPDTGDEIGNW